jgi:F420-dependent oxidoreductase-like protein
MKIGLQVPNFTYPGGPAQIPPVLARIAGVADDAGFHSLWVMDHYFQIQGFGDPENEMLEAYSTLGWLAALTRKIRLGALATGVIYRYPGVLVKTVTTLDVLSGGRAYFCIGAAWFEGEARALGVPFPAMRERFERLEETLQIATQMWSDNDGPYRGRHYQLERALCRPQPLSRPRPPIMVAGTGEKKTLRLVAQYADACNMYGSVEVLEAKIAVLRRHCDDLKRDFNSLEVSSLSTVQLAPGKMSSRDVIGLCEKLAAIGVRHAIFNIADVHEIEPLEVFGREIIPAVEGL